MLIRPLLAVASLAALAGCSAAPAETAAESESRWTEYAGTAVLAPGWSARQVFEGNADLWAPSRDGALLADGDGWSYAFPKHVAYQPTALLGVETRSSMTASPIDAAAQRSFGAVIGGVSTASGPAVLYDESWYSGGSRFSSAVRVARLGPAGWSTAVVDETLRPDALRVPVSDLCVTTRGGRVAALYTAGSSYLDVADEGEGGQFTIVNMRQQNMHVGPRACAGGQSDLWFSLGGNAFDPFRVVRHRAGEAAPSESAALTIGPKLLGAALAVGDDDRPVVAYADATTLRLATRATSGDWSTEIVALPFPAEQLVPASLSLTIVAGDPVLTVVRRGYHPTAIGVGKDGIWLMHRANGAWRSVELYTPPGGWVKTHGMVVAGGRATLGLAHWQYAGAYRNVVIEGPLP